MSMMASCQAVLGEDEGVFEAVNVPSRTPQMG